MIKRTVLILSLMIIVISQQAISDESVSFRFVKFIGNIPYVIVTDPVELAIIQKDILGSWIDNRLNYNYYLDTTSVEVVSGLYLYYENSLTPTAYEIKRKHDAFTHWDYIIQSAKKDGSGIQERIHPEKAFYHATQNQSFIIIKCHPINTKSVFMENKKSYFNAAIPAHRLISDWQERIPKNFIDSIPQSIINKSDSIAKKFLASLAYYNENFEDKHQTIVPIRYFQDGISRIYYCQVVSYGSKDFNSRLDLFDQSGEIQETIEGTEFVEIIGITDVNRDGSHEVIMLYSVDGYSGGIELLTLEACGSTDHIRINVNTRLDTFFD